jgi:hypothetical protein
VFADALFELGIPGAFFMAAYVYTTVGSLRRLFATQSDDPVARAAIATLVAMSTYLMLLANKQGFIWNLHALFMFTLIGQRLAARIDEPGIARPAEEQGQPGMVAASA